MRPVHYPSINLAQARRAYDELDRRLKRSAPLWLDETAVAILDRPGNMIFALRGDLALGASLQDAHDRARSALLSPDEPIIGGITIRRGDGMQLGAVGVFGPDSQSSHIIACMLCELIFEDDMPDSMLSDIVNHRFAAAGFPSPIIPVANQPSISIFTGLAALKEGAEHTSLLLGQTWGWPPVIEPELPQPKPDVTLIERTDIPGFGGGLIY